MLYDLGRRVHVPLSQWFPLLLMVTTIISVALAVDIYTSSTGIIGI